MKYGDWVKAQAMWPRTPERGSTDAFEWVKGRYQGGMDALAWVKDETGEYRACLAATVQVIVALGSIDQEPDPTPTVRARVLDEAKRITATDRNSAYGEPEDNFQRIADFWNVFLGPKLKDKITPGDTAALMIMVKLAREMNAPKEDNKVDGAGYFACWAEVDSKS